MTTNPARIALTLFAALSLGACASRTAAPSAASALAAVPAPTVVAENAGGEWLDVYVVHELGEWHLGRLAPGARSTFRLPLALRDRPAGMVRVAVISGAARTARPSRDPRAVISIAQPVGSVLGQRWTFAQGQLTGRLPYPR